MKNNIHHDDAIDWLDMKLTEAEYGEDDVIEYIKEMLWQYEDLRNS